MNKQRYTVKEFIEALKATAGIKATIAKKLGCDRETVVNYIKRYPTIKKAYEDECESVKDMAESEAIKKIQNGESDMIKFYLRTKCKDRGYAEKIPEGLPDQGSTQENSLIYFNSLPPEQALLRLQDMAATLQEAIAQKISEVATK